MFFIKKGLQLNKEISYHIKYNVRAADKYCLFV